MESYIKWLELIAALSAIINWKYFKHNSFVKHLAILIFFIVTVEFTGSKIRTYFTYNIYFYNFIVEPGLFILYALAFYKGFVSVVYKKIAKYGIFLTLILYFAFLPTVNYNVFLNVIGYNIGALFIALLAILKVLEIINLEDEIDFLKNPITYLLLSIIFYYLITIPHYSVSYYFYISKPKSENFGNTFLAYIDIIFNYLLYINYTILFFLWEKKKHQF